MSSAQIIKDLVATNKTPPSHRNYAKSKIKNWESYSDKIYPDNTQYSFGYGTKVTPARRVEINRAKTAPEKQLLADKYFEEDFGKAWDGWLIKQRELHPDLAKNKDIATSVSSNEFNIGGDWASNQKKFPNAWRMLKAGDLNKYGYEMATGKTLNTRAVRVGQVGRRLYEELSPIVNDKDTWGRIYNNIVSSFDIPVVGEKLESEERIHDFLDLAGGEAFNRPVGDEGFPGPVNIGRPEISKKASINRLKDEMGKEIEVEKEPSFLENILFKTFR